MQRGELRRLLLDSLPAGTVRWGHKVSGVRALGRGRHEVTFAGGAASVTTGLLAGADGAWSRVRPLVTDAVPACVGKSVVETYLFDSEDRHPATAKAAGGGMMIAPAPDREIVAHRERAGTLHASVGITAPKEWFTAIDFGDARAAAARTAGEFGGWAPEITALITRTDTPPVLRLLHALPRGHRWERVPGVTLLGDAAHLAPPNGEGANLAMLDGADPGRALAAHPEDLEAALGLYEQAMFPRSAAAALSQGTGRRTRTEATGAGAVTTTCSLCSPGSWRSPARGESHSSRPRGGAFRRAGAAGPGRHAATWGRG